MKKFYLGLAVFLTAFVLVGCGGGSSSSNSSGALGKTLPSSVSVSK